ncbi:thiosulfate dehydrogenase [quinone] large subunit [Mesonia phycicola]|uniref:Thiosulfate dehydrogenase [quinone] large subunit n=1 Tax=Mesonia phycicola TaxID=579105 RepID=A0A1M6CRS4_9FLAO|nr:DoxX family membrane protein [Mesonia phycicola]SHI63670.1 thiosulfate dehydrogenase [quinone] large subunit [Mesonia phycicola]
MNNNQLAFLLARITLGINFFLHGLVRIPKLVNFANGVTKGFEDTLLPLILVKPMAYGIPIVEIILGILLTLGISSRKTLTATAVFIIILISGSAFKEDWGAINVQMLYALFVFFLIKNLSQEVWTIGSKINQTNKPQ